jgi:hypothetical protein
VKPTTTLVRAAAALSILGVRALRRKRDYGGAAEENTYGLPQGEPISRELRKWLAAQRAAVLSAIPETGPLPDQFPALSGPDWDEPMARAMTPILGNYWDQEGKDTYARLGLDPEDWKVTNPKLAGQIQKQSFTFCASTNATTDLRLHRALEALRDAFAAGLVAEGETLPQLAKRVGSIFKGLSSQHAELIAATEASRAVHAAQLAADHDSGVVSGLELMLSSDACPLCRKIATECRRVRLGHAFAIVGEHPEYSQIRHPPLHPYCQCTVIEVLSPEYGGPSDPEWGATLIQPQKQISKDGGAYKPPAGKPVPEPEPDRPKPKVTKRPPRKPKGPDPVVAKPAGNPGVQRAVDYARGHGVAVDPSGNDLIVKAFGPTNAQDIPAVYGSKRKMISLNEKSPLWADPGGTMKRLHGAGWFSTDDPDHIIRHEVGHALHDRADPAYYEHLKTRKLTKDQQKRITKHVSAYGATSPLEFVAETYAGLVDGKVYNKRIMDFYLALKGPIP